MHTSMIATATRAALAPTLVAVAVLALAATPLPAMAAGARHTAQADGTGVSTRYTQDTTRPADAGDREADAGRAARFAVKASFVNNARLA